MLFEKYGSKDDPASAVQQFYLRPDRATLVGMQQQEAAATASYSAQMAAVALGAEPEHHSPPNMMPNGIPLSRLDQMRASQAETISRMRASARKVRAALLLCAGGGGLE